MSELPAFLTQWLKTEWPDVQQVGSATPVSPEMVTTAAMGPAAVIEYAERRAAHGIRQRALDDGRILITAIKPRWTWTRAMSYHVPALENALTHELPWNPASEVPAGAFFLVCRVSALAVKPLPDWRPEGPGLQPW